MRLLDRIRAIEKALSGAEPREIDAISAYVITACNERTGYAPRVGTASAQIIEENARLKARIEDLTRYVVTGESMSPAALVENNERLRQAIKPVIRAAGKVPDDVPDYTLGGLRLTAGQVRALRAAIG